MGKVFNDELTGDVFVQDSDDRRVWDTNFPPVNWMPEDERILLNNFDIDFPDFTKGGGYGYERKTSPFGFDSDGCITTVTLLPQSWTSGWSTIGSVPSGCNVIDVRGSVTRTKAPSNLLGIPVSNNLPTSEVVFVGGWCIVESEFIFARTFEFRLSGSSVQFRRSQSTRAAQAGENPSWNQNWSADFYVGWSHFGGAGAANGALAGIIQESTGAQGAGDSRQRGGPLACSMNTAGFDFSSSYRGNFAIRPGRIPS